MCEKSPKSAKFRGCCPKCANLKCKQIRDLNYFGRLGSSGVLPHIPEVDGSNPLTKNYRELISFPFFFEWVGIKLVSWFFEGAEAYKSSGLELIRRVPFARRMVRGRPPLGAPLFLVSPFPQTMPKLCPSAFIWA